MISQAKKLIPSSCYICNTLFIQMGIIRNMSEDKKEVTKHVDNTVLFYIGFPRKGGEANYYSGLTSKNYGELKRQIQCEHESINIGRFDKIVHSAESWEGYRNCINFNLKKKC